MSFELHSYSPCQSKRTLFLFVVRAQVLCFLFFQDTFWFLWKQNNQEKKKKVQTKKSFVSAKLTDKRNILLFCFFFVYLIFNFISPNVCHWDMFFWRGATEFTVTETIIFPFFFVNKQPIFLSQWPFSLFAKICLSDRIFPENFFACGGLTNLWVTFRNYFFTQKTVWKTLLSSVFDTFLSKKRIPKCNS